MTQPSSNTHQDQTYDSIKERLDSLVDAVKDDNLSLDDALDRYEEALSLAHKATSMIDVAPADDSSGQPNLDNPE